MPKEADSVLEWRPEHRYICTYCSHVVASVKEYRAHIRLMHPRRVRQSSYQLYPCQKCPYVSNRMDTIVMHNYYHGLSTAVKCPKCAHLADSEEYLKTHAQLCKGYDRIIAQEPGDGAG